MRVSVLLLALAASLCALAPATEAAAQPVPRVDEAKRDPALFLVRDAVLRAARAHDLDGVLRHTIPDSRASVGQVLGNGWGWDELVWILENGGTLSGDEFDAPYTLQVNYAGGFAGIGIVVGENIPAHAEASDRSPVVRRYSNEIVRVKDWRTAETAPRPFYKRTDWIELRTETGKRSFMPARFVRPHTDYRVFFQRLLGAWQLAVFTSGE